MLTAFPPIALRWHTLNLNNKFASVHKSRWTRTAHKKTLHFVSILVGMKETWTTYIVIHIVTTSIHWLQCLCTYMCFACVLLFFRYNCQQVENRIIMKSKMATNVLKQYATIIAPIVYLQQYMLVYIADNNSN